MKILRLLYIWYLPTMFFLICASPVVSRLGSQPRGRDSNTRQFRNLVSRFRLHLCRPTSSQLSYDDRIRCHQEVEPARGGLATRPYTPRPRKWSRCWLSEIQPKRLFPKFNGSLWPRWPLTKTLLGDVVGIS